MKHICLFVLRGLINLWLKTLRYHPHGDVIDQQGVILFLHGHQFGLLLHRPQSPLVTPISLSRDGDLQVHIMQGFGIQSVRGSRSKGALSVLKALLRQIQQGKTVLMALDGSRGPYGVPQPGGFFLAEKENVPLWFCYISNYKGIRLKSWDRFILPYPFSTVFICTKQLNLSSIEHNRRRREEKMDELCSFIKQSQL